MTRKSTHPSYWQTCKVLCPWALFVRQQCLSVCFYFIGVVDAQVQCTNSRRVLLIVEIKLSASGPEQWQLMAALFRCEVDQRCCHPMGKTSLLSFLQHTEWQMTELIKSVTQLASVDDVPSQQVTTFKSSYQQIGLNLAAPLFSLWTR